MSGEFLEVCQGLSPEVAGRHRERLLACLDRVFDDPEVALVFLLALEGLIEDKPRLDVLERRVRILVDRFAADEA